MTRVNTGQNWYHKLLDCQARNRSLRRQLRAERARWDAKCPKGHLERYDECDLVGCYVTVIDPIDPPIYTARSIKAAQTYHQWVTDDLVSASRMNSEALEKWLESVRPFLNQFPLEHRVGWWWRVPYGWWLAFTKWIGGLRWQ